MAVDVNNVGSISEHLDVIIILVGVLATWLLGALVYIFNGMRSEVRDIKDSLNKISEEMFSRVRDVEMSIERLWGEHRATHELNGKK